MTYPQRLDLRKEDDGMRVYDERRDESLKIIEDTGRHRPKIQVVICFIDSRLAELESE